MVAKHIHTIFPVTLAIVEQVSSGIYLFGFPGRFRFEAGQVIGIALSEDGPRRLYSICSGEKDNEVWILYNVINEGYR